MPDKSQHMPQVKHQGASRRKRERIVVPKAAIVTSLDGSKQFACTMNDFSKDGARVALPNAAQGFVFEECYLINVAERAAHKSRVIWRSNREVGLSYLDSTPLADIRSPALGFLLSAWMKHATR